MRRTLAVALSLSVLAGAAAPAEAHQRRRRKPQPTQAVRHRPRHVHGATRAATTPTFEKSTSCGGDLPPCRVLRRESGGDPKVWNGGCYMPVGSRGHCPGKRSTASGKWQFVRGTWNNHGGFLNAADAPAEVQDEKARLLWNGGRGCRHWRAC